MNTELVACDYHYLKEVDSTNDALKKLSLQKDLPEGYCLLSEYQTSGRGQYGNQWDSEPGQNLLMSLFLRPIFLPASEAYRLTMSVCLALVDLGKFYGLDTEIKWPNDWFFQGRKIAGVLAESSLRGSRIESCIVGIGINVRQSEFKHPLAISLSALTQMDLEPIAVFEKLAEHLDFRYRQLKMGQADLQLKAFIQVLYGREEWVAVRRNGKDLKMKCLGVEPHGALQVLWADGSHETLQHQEISFLF